MAEYIEREALRSDIRESYNKLLEIHNGLVDQYAIDICRAELMTFCEILLRIKDFPTADVAPVVHGRWIPDGNTVCCSECKTLGSPQWKGCPVCLARMGG